MSTRWTRISPGELRLKKNFIPVNRIAVDEHSCVCRSKLRINVDVTVAMKCQREYPVSCIAPSPKDEL